MKIAILQVKKKEEGILLNGLARKTLLNSGDLTFLDFDSYIVSV